MPAWIKKVIQRRTVQVSAGTPVVLETDPAFIREIAAADDKKGWLFIESIDANVTVKLWRHEGARADLLRQLDATASPHLSLNTAGLAEVTWTPPLGAASKCVLEVSISAGSGSVTLDMDDVYRTRGG